jgi:hypothetical protein
MHPSKAKKISDAVQSTKLILESFETVLIKQRELSDLSGEAGDE